MEEKLTLAKKQQQFDRRVFWGMALLACFLTFLVCPFSPIYRYNFEPDEICYQIMSQGWLQGRVPYRDLFDHKGPLSYLIYMLGLLLSGQRPIGILFVFMAINAGIFILIYRTLRLCFDPDRSLVSTLLLITLFFIKKESLYASATKPDHFILLMLLISEYLYVRGFKRYGADKSNSAQADEVSSATSVLQVFTLKEMLIIGLCCGAVFMVKLNVCIYYLTFIGFYLLWLLIRKNWKSFFSSCGMFLLGIGAVSVPFMIYFCGHHALSDFFYAYFKFNSSYAKNGGIHLLFSRPFIDEENTLVILILFVFLLLAVSVFLKTSQRRMTRIILVLCGLVSYGMIALPEVFMYTFVLLIPLYIWGCAVLVDLLFAFLSPKIMRIAFFSLTILVTVNFAVYQTILYPSIPREVPPVEQAMDEYYETHPDSTTLFFFNRCYSFYYSKTTTVPNFQYFYIPREGPAEMYTSQMQYIRAGLPDVIAFWRPDSMDDDYMMTIDGFLEENGYCCYFEVNEDYLTYVYVRASTLT